jgi:mono/diheme cytochrome c family protein
MINLLAIIFINTAWSMNLNFKSCSSCHVENNQQVINYFSSENNYLNMRPKSNACTACHINLIEQAKLKDPLNFTTPFTQKSMQKLMDDNSFGQIPALDNFKKFTDCGITNFLSTPFPRKFNANESMFPLLKADVIHLTNQMKLEKCRSELPGNSTLGKKLYIQNNCIHCHSENGNGPKLRIGYQLLSSKYFKYRLLNNKSSLHSLWTRTQNTYFQRKRVKTIMPIFNFSESEINSIYKYISESKEDLNQISIPAENKNSLYGVKLYESVSKNIFQATCQHCHANNLQINADNLNIFNLSKPQISSFELPMPNEEITNKKRLFDLFSPGKDCSDSKLVSVLKERHNEWIGHKKNSFRGMPLTQKPIAYKYINQLIDWTKQGCPTGNEFLCKPCIN